MVGSRQPSALVVHFQGRQVAVLRPGGPAFTFGRNHDRTLRFGHNSVNGAPDRHIPRNVGSIRCNDRLWVVSNDSKTRPFEIIVRGVSNPLPPRSSPEANSIWAVSPPGLDIQISAPSKQFRLSVSVDNPLLWIPDRGNDGDPSTLPLPVPTDRERLLLAAKFLALHHPGDAVGNREAADYASAARPPEELVTPKAVEDCVGRWGKRLQELGVTEIDGRNNIDQLGRQLLAWGVLRQEDRTLLRPYGRR